MQRLTDILYYLLRATNSTCKHIMQKNTLLLRANLFQWRVRTCDEVDDDDDDVAGGGDVEGEGDEIDERQHGDAVEEEEQEHHAVNKQTRQDLSAVTDSY